MTSPFEDLILVEIKSQLLNLKNAPQLFEHVHTYRTFYGQLNIEGLDGTAEEALQKWVVRLTLESPTVEDSEPPLQNVFEELLTIRGKQTALMEQHSTIIDKLRTALTPHLSLDQTVSLLECVHEMHSKKQHDIHTWSAAYPFLRWRYTNDSIKEFQTFLTEENIDIKHAPVLFQAAQGVLQELEPVDKRVVALQSHFSKVCFEYRKSRSREHFHKEVVQDRIYKFNVLEKITQLLEDETTPAFVQAVHGWGQLYVDGQNDEWNGWDILVNHLKNSSDEAIPQQLHESASNLRQIS